MRLSDNIWSYALYPNQVETLIEQNKIIAEGNAYPDSVHANTIVTETAKLIEKRNAVYVAVALTALATLAATFVGSTFLSIILVFATAAGIDHTRKCCNELYETVMNVKQELEKIDKEKA